MFWTVFAGICAAISAVAALLSLPAVRKSRHITIGEVVTGKQLKTKMNGLEVSGELEAGLSNQYWIHVCNIGDRENGIRSLTIYLGNPNLDSHIIDIYPVSENGHYLQLKSGEATDIYLDSCRIVRSFQARINPYNPEPKENVFILIKDLRGNRYTLNTFMQIKHFMALIST